MHPFFGERYLVDVTNLAMKEFVDHISAPATIRDYVNIVKAVVASARDVKREALFMRDWDDELIDALTQMPLVFKLDDLFAKYALAIIKHRTHV